MTDTDHNAERSGPIAWMVKNSIAANLLMIILIGGGLWSAFTMQKEVFPQFQLDVVDVSVAYPGAAPSEVEQGILQPIEEAVKGVQGIKDRTSSAGEGSGTVTLELVTGTERMKAFQEIDQAVNRIRTFPDDIEAPEVRLQSQQREVMSVGIYGEVDIWTLRKLAERFRDQQLSDPALTQVEISNVPDYITHVEIPRAALREYGMTLGDVARLIEQSSRDIPAGGIETFNGEILLRMKERKLWADEFGEIRILTDENGGAVTLADLAKITDGFEESGFHSRFNRTPSVELGIFRIGSQSPLEIADAMQRNLESFNATLPVGVTTRIDSNVARDYRERLALLIENGVLAIIIVLAILSVFLEFKLAFWVMMGMTTSFIGGLLLVPLIGVSINMISMFAFLLVLGIVVDDAIVVGENVYEYRKNGMNPVEAAVQGARDISGPVVFSILSTVIAFTPLLFLPGTTGKFWWPLPAVVITVLFISLIEALFILPAHLRHIQSSSRNRAGRMLHTLQQRFADGVSHFINTKYRGFLKRCLDYRYITLCTSAALLTVVGGYGCSAHMGMIMMPEVPADEIEAGIRLPVGTTPAQAGEVALEVTENTLAMFDEHNLYEQVEGVKTNVRGQNFIDVEIVMKRPSERTMTAKDVIELWRENIGDIKGVDQMTFEAESGPGGWRDDISVDLSHNDIDVLEEASEAMLADVETFQTTRDISDNYNKGKTQFDLLLRPEARQLGLTSAEVGQQVRDAFYGALALRQLRGTNEIEIRVKLPKPEREDLYHLENLQVLTSDGIEVPLMDVVEIREGEAFTSINRRAGRRIVTVGMNVEPKRAITQVIAALNSEVLPNLRSEFPGLTWTFQGSQADMRESTRALWGGFALAMAMVYAMLAIAFRSYSQPLIIMVAIPFGLVGAVIGHILLGFDLSLISLMGLVALSGVVVNDSLIMIDYANRNRGEGPAFDAILQAGVRRFRPILLTTMTTFGGLTPIILETSGQAAYLIPMAISLGFGIVFSTAIILVLVPCLYLVLEDLNPA
ncbi:MAG: efflux RND transporter permease subunit [Kiritimatiellae bacterium]|jgi:multidrug efflux pump subunit AcrB|nr:efflux RND transporter permease subunit [Kiritimatiellia bacterium]